MCGETRIPRAQTKMKSIKEELQDAQDRVKELEVCSGFVVWVCVTSGWIMMCFGILQKQVNRAKEETESMKAEAERLENEQPRIEGQTVAMGKRIAGLHAALCLDVSYGCICDMQKKRFSLSGRWRKRRRAQNSRQRRTGKQLQKRRFFHEQQNE